MLKKIGVLLVFLFTSTICNSQEIIGKVNVSNINEYISDAFNGKANAILENQDKINYYKKQISRVSFYSLDNFPKNIDYIVLQNNIYNKSILKDYNSLNPLRFSIFGKSNSTVYYRIKDASYIIGVNP